ncbi:ion transporter [Pragia fontium]|uniref:ion transporter n=1 Tax=Pragia fontium TaxID=82985 RepID=UPI00064B0E8C|nr:ion transporter [Pragia fontium]AKJ42528.1 hypothetical protein QQ39_10885 [Pragia fontium]
MSKSVDFHNLTKRRIYLLFFSMQTPIGRAMSLFWGGVALLSVLMVFMYMGGLGFRYDNPGFYYWMDILFLFLFTLEYLMRLWVTPRAQHYASSIMGIIDLFTTISMYLVILLPNVVIQYESIIRLWRILCILRIFRLLGFVDDLRFFHHCIAQAKSKLLLFLTSIVVLVFIVGGIMFVVEGPGNGFTSLWASIYWAVVTLTTVGYGDITPDTPVGRMIASGLIILGYLSLAIPTSILSAYVIAERKRRGSHPCPTCHHIGHDSDAKYCKYCGGALRK